MKVALVHHWLLRMRGGERVLEAIAELFPEADIFTLFYDPAGVSETLQRRRITASWLNRLPFARRVYPNLLPLYPAGCRGLKLAGYDLVISSDSALVKGVTVPEGALHVCYCHAPPRYLWDMADQYLANAGPVTRMAARVLFPRLRAWDRAAAQKVDFFVANSENVRRRIQRHYGRDSAVIYPPVEVFEPAAADGPRDYYLFAGQLVPYKRADLAIEAAGRLGRKLVVIGDGPERTRLKRMCAPNVTFSGWQDAAGLRRALAGCRALLFPGEEDFGLIPVEAQMAGRPVIAFGRGGALETVADGRTGLFFAEQTAASLAEAILRFEACEDSFRTEDLRRSAMRFEKAVFMRAFGEFVRQALRSKKTS